MQQASVRRSGRRYSLGLSGRRKRRRSEAQRSADEGADREQPANLNSHQKRTTFPRDAIQIVCEPDLPELEHRCESKELRPDKSGDD